MAKSTIDSKTIKVLKEWIGKDSDLVLNHVYDMGENWLFSVRTNKDADLMDPYHIADKKTLKVQDFAMLNHLKEFQAALKRKVY